jgi:hypothetical protein
LLSFAPALFSFQALSFEFQAITVVAFTTTRKPLHPPAVPHSLQP